MFVSNPNNQHVSFPESTFERATGEVCRRLEEGASDPSHQEGGVGAGAVVGGVHYHRWCADLPRLPLRVSRQLVGTSAPQVRKCSEEELHVQMMSFAQERGWPRTFEMLLMNSFSPSPRIKEEPSAVVCPVIDVIDWNTFQYLGNAGEPQIGGFDWRLVFTWHSVPEHEQKRRRSPTDVIRCVCGSYYWREEPSPILPAGTDTSRSLVCDLSSPQVSYYGRWPVCCEQEVLPLPGDIWHRDGGVGRREPGILLQGENVGVCYRRDLLTIHTLTWNLHSLRPHKTHTGLEKLGRSRFALTDSCQQQPVENKSDLLILSFLVRNLTTSCFPRTKIFLLKNKKASQAPSQ